MKDLDRLENTLLDYFEWKKPNSFNKLIWSLEAPRTATTPSTTISPPGFGVSLTSWPFHWDSSFTRPEPKKSRWTRYKGHKNISSYGMYGMHFFQCAHLVLVGLSLFPGKQNKIYHLLSRSTSLLGCGLWPLCQACASSSSWTPERMATPRSSPPWQPVWHTMAYTG